MNALGDSSLLISDTFHNRIRYVSSATGIIQTVAGTGRNCQTAGTCQVIDPAAPNPPSSTSVDLCLPVATEPVIPAGNGFYIADACRNPGTGPTSNQVRWSRGDGKMVTSAGGLDPGYVDGPALTARFNGVADIRMVPDGGYIVSDAANCRIREVKDGVVTTIAGSGPTPCIPFNSTLADCQPLSGGNGDGGPPLLARLDVPAYVDVNSSGGIFIADQCDNRVRYIYPDRSKIVTVAGTGGAPGWNGDGPALSTQLAWPDAVLVSEALNGILVTDTGNNRVRFVSQTPPP